MAHEPVLLQEVIEGLELKKGKIVVDATVNRGGHAQAICRVLGPQGKFFGFDKDRNALAEADQNLAGSACQYKLIHGGFEDLAFLLKNCSVEPGEVDAFLFDLGISSEQLEKSGRGFSFQTDDPLLMTFDDKSPPGSLTAAEIANSWLEQEISAVLSQFGEEPFAKQIAKAIVHRRKTGVILTVQQLVNIIAEAVPIWYKKRRLHFATRTFQALRMAVNDEIEALKKGMAAAWNFLRIGGRIAIITFHSLEGREVKNFFKDKKTAASGRIITKHATQPDREELLRNPRSRSAKLRIIQKVK